jgi:hypothetical protein
VAPLEVVQWLFLRVDSVEELEDGSGFLVAVLASVRGCFVAMFSCFAVAEVSSWIWFGN